MAAKLRPTDPPRVLRALEVLEATGTSLAVYQRIREPALLSSTEAVAVFMAPDRDRLYEAIGRRFDAMMDEGALNEAAALADRNLDPSLPAMRALGVKDLIDTLSDPSCLPFAVSAAKQATRHYAKRQFTFARHQLPELSWVRPEDAYEHVLREWEGSRY